MHTANIFLENPTKTMKDTIENINAKLKIINEKRVTLQFGLNLATGLKCIKLLSSF